MYFSYFIINEFISFTYYYVINIIFCYSVAKT